MTDNVDDAAGEAPQAEDVVLSDVGEALPSILKIIDLQTRLTETPDEVGDVEIRAAFGEEHEPSAIRTLFANSRFGRMAKDRRASARGRLRRRLNDLAWALDAAESAIDEVFEAPGRTNGRAGLENVKAAIGQLRSELGLDVPKIADVGEVRPFEDMFEGPGAWTGVETAGHAPSDDTTASADPGNTSD